MWHKAKQQMSKYRILNVGVVFKCSKCFNVQMSLLKANTNQNKPEVPFYTHQIGMIRIHVIAHAVQHVKLGTFLLCCLDVQTCTTTLEINLTVSLRTRNDSTSRLSHTTPGYITKRCTPISQNIVQLCL